MAVGPSALNVVACLPLKSRSRSYISPQRYGCVCTSLSKALRLSKKAGLCPQEAVLDSACKMKMTRAVRCGQHTVRLCLPC